MYFSDKDSQSIGAKYKWVICKAIGGCADPNQGCQITILKIKPKIDCSKYMHFSDKDTQSIGVKYKWVICNTNGGCADPHQGCQLREIKTSQKLAEIIDIEAIKCINDQVKIYQLKNENGQIIYIQARTHCPQEQIDNKLNYFRLCGLNKSCQVSALKTNQNLAKIKELQKLITIEGGPMKKTTTLQSWSK